MGFAPLEASSARKLAVAFWLSSVQFAHGPKQATDVPVYKGPVLCGSLLSAVTKTLVR